MNTQQLVLAAVTLAVQLYAEYKANQAVKGQTALSFDDFHKMAETKANQIVDFADSEIAKAEADLNQQS